MADKIITFVTDETFKAVRFMHVETTLAQLRHFGGNRILSWGISERVAIAKRAGEIRALRLTVNGLHHKGYVYISLNGLDLYDVHITTRGNEILHTITDLYFDDLFDAIDQKIEFIPSYKH